MDCGAMLTAPSDMIFSPDQTGDGKYDSLMTCEWTVNLGDDFVIVFHIKEMDIQESSGCKDDYLEVIHKKKATSLFHLHRF